LFFPFRRYRRRLDICSTDVPAQPLFKDVVNVVAALFPSRHGVARFQGNRAPLPDVLNARPNDLLRIDLQHFGGGVLIVPNPAQPPPTSQAPSCAAWGAVSKDCRLVKINREIFPFKTLKPNINQAFLICKPGHEGPPPLAPIPDRQNITLINMGVAVEPPARL